MPWCFGGFLVATNVVSSSSTGCFQVPVWRRLGLSFQTFFDQLPASEDGMPTKKMHGKSSLMHLWCSGFRWKQDGCEVVCSVIFQI